MVASEGVTEQLVKGGRSDALGEKDEWDTARAEEIVREEIIYCL